MTGYEPTYWYLDQFRCVRLLSRNPMVRTTIGSISDGLLKRAFPDLRIGDVFRAQKMAIGIDIVRVARTAREHRF